MSRRLNRRDWLGWSLILLFGSLRPVCGVLAATTQAADWPIEAPVEAVVREDSAIEIRFSPGAENWLTYALVADEDVEAIHLSLRGATGDMDLFARWNEQMGQYDEADHIAASPRGNETLRIARSGHPRLRTGVYYLDVVRLEDLPREAILDITFERGFEPPADFFDAPRPEESAEDDEATVVIADDALFTLPFRNEEESYHTLRIEVPRRTTRVLVEVRGGRGDLDLHAKRGSPLADWEDDPEFQANTGNWDERLMLEGPGSYLKSGPYYVDVVNYLGLDRLGPVEVRVDFDPPSEAPLPASGGPVIELSPGQPLIGTIDRDRTRADRYRFLLPEGSPRLHVGTLNATRDIDLFLRAGSPVTRYDDAEGYDHCQISARLDESLTIEAEPGESLAPGWWYLDVVSLTDSDQRIRYELRLDFDSPTTSAATDWAEWMPDTADSQWSPLERVLLATVEISCENGSGSGTCVRPNGLILTNYHVLSGDGGFQTEGIFVSLTHDFRAEPRQLFTARVIEADAELDLALLRIDGDVFGHPLPPDLRLPFVPLGDDTALKLGDPVYVAGFPDVGGEENRYSLSLTRGILTGFNRLPSGELGWIKTDALINAGNSGGTLLSVDGLRFIGIPSRKIILEDDRLGYCRPVDLVPAAWRRHFE